MILKVLLKFAQCRNDKIDGRGNYLPNKNININFIDYKSIRRKCTIK